MTTETVATLVQSDDLTSPTSLSETAKIVIADNNTFQTLAPSAVAFVYQARNAANAALAAALPQGTYFIMAGLPYVVEAGGGAFTDLSVSGANPAVFVSPEHYGAVEFGSGVSTDAVNRARQYAATSGLPGRSLSQKYDLDGTITTNGQVSWDWGFTILSWQNVDWDSEDLTNTDKWTEIQERPSGATEDQPSGYYVLFDTLGMAGSREMGYLRIGGTLPSKFDTVTRATVPSNVVGLTCSTGTSEEITWDVIDIRGCDEALWQGDQRATAIGDILPTTGWSVRETIITFCNRAIRGGQAGNMTDDANWGVVRIKRCGEFGVLRSSFNCANLFMNGLQQTGANNDLEAQTVSMPRASGSDNSFTVASGGALNASVGDVLYVYGANIGPDGSEDIPFVSHIATLAGDGLSGTTESVPDQSVTGADIHINPTKPFRGFNAAINVAGELFLEEAAEMFIDIEQNFTITAAEIGYSDGRIGCMYNTPILMRPIDGGLVTGALNERCINNPKAKALVGVGIQQNSSDDSWNGGTVVLTCTQQSTSITDSHAVRAVQLEDDHINSGYEARFNDLHPGTFNAVVEYADGRVQYHISGAVQEAFKTGPNGGFEIEANLRGATDMSGVTTTGSNTTLDTDHIDKTAGGAGGFYEAVSVATGDRLRVKVVVSAFTAGNNAGITIKAFDGSAVDITPRTMRIGTAGTYYTYFDAPASMARIGMDLPSATACIIDSMVVQKVLSA
jgi:hypothetical protein